MTMETDPIADDEWLLRRVWHEHVRLQRTPINSPTAFEPRVKAREPDIDGISLYRAACLNDLIDVLATIAAEKRSMYAIVRIRVSFLKTLNLTVIAAPEPRIPGHTVIPELNASTYASAKQAMKSTLVALAEEASRLDNIVQRPES